jgi:Mn-dependent DtxR family transcriptional regulator
MPQHLTLETITAIRKRRKARQKTSDIAQALGIHTNTVLKYTRDMRKPRRPALTPAEHRELQAD